MNLNELIEKIGPFITSNAEVLAFGAAIVATILVLVLLFRLNSGEPSQEKKTVKPSTATAPVDKSDASEPLKSPLSASGDEIAKPEKRADAIAEQFAPASPIKKLESNAPVKAKSGAPEPSVTLAAQPQANAKQAVLASENLVTIEAELIALKALFKDRHISAEIYALKSQQIARKLSQL